MRDEFYIGWEEQAPPGLARRIRGVAALLLGVAISLGVALALAQQTIGISAFEWGNVKSFSGLFKSQPYPHLVVWRPGARDGQAPFSSYYLVKPFKFGLDAETARRFDGRQVSLRGTLIYRGGQTMIEVVTGSLQAAAGPAPDRSAAARLSPLGLGQQTLAGEIVDSKCYLGVMNPGALTPHRACAIRCLSGGIPPVLLVRRTNGPALCLLLISQDGTPVNKQVLDLVAEPVSITGEIERQGEWWILRADPATYRRVPR